MEIRGRRVGDRTVLARLLSGELLRARPLTADAATARVALVQCAAGLLGGDRLVLDVALEAGARMELVDVGALVVQPARGAAPATIEVRIALDDGARLVWAARPLVVAAGARVQRTTTALLGGGAQLLVRDTVVLGREGEAPGALRSATRIELDGRPLHEEAIDTADLALLRSPAVLGGGRVLDVVARYGTRGAAEPALQLHGPGTLHVQVVGEAAAAEPTASATFERWRDEVLIGAPVVGPTGQVVSARQAVSRP